MKPRVLAISGSPRPRGNTEALLEAALEGARSAGAETGLIALRQTRLSPCVACNSCFKTGLCRIEDEFTGILDQLLTTDRIIFGSPVFFMNVTAQAKLMIDRCQCLWSRKYVLKQPIIDPPRVRLGMVIAVGGSKGKKMFECVQWTMKHWFDVLDMRFAAALYVNQVDAKGDVGRHPAAFREAKRLGQALVEDDQLGAEKTVKCELFGGIA